MLTDPQVVKKLNTLGYQVSFLACDEFKDFVFKGYEQWKSVANPPTSWWSEIEAMQ